MPEQFNVAVLTPTTGICQMGYAQCMVRLAMYFAQVRVFEDLPEQGLDPYAIAGSAIGANYETMVKRYLEDDRVHWTHFLSVEDDMVFPPDALHRLARHQVPIVGCNYSTNKGERQRFTAGNNGSRVITRHDSTGLEEVELLPQGFTLVAREVYETIPRPWYTGGYHQDYYFSERARNHGYTLYVDHDLSKQIRHIGPKVYTYEDALRDSELAEVA
jgi:hypothetical protein